MSEVVLQDQEILDRTTQVNEGDWTQLKIVLPSTNRVVTSEKMKRSDLKGRTLIDWCEAIRGQMRADYQGNRDEMEAKRQRRIKEEDEAREKAAEAAREVTGEVISGELGDAIILPDVESEMDSEEPKLIIPNEVKSNDSTQNGWSEDSARLWADYGAALAKVKRLEKILTDREEL